LRQTENVAGFKRGIEFPMTITGYAVFNYHVDITHWYIAQHTVY